MVTCTTILILFMFTPDSSCIFVDDFTSSLKMKTFFLEYVIGTGVSLLFESHQLINPTGSLLVMLLNVLVLYN